MDAGVSDEEDHRDEIERVAAEWVVRIGGAALGADARRQLDDWLAASADHRAAFDKASATWAAFDELRQHPGPLRAVIEPPQKPARLRWTGAAVGAVLVCAVIGAAYQFGNPWLALSADYRTAAAELRSIRLPDGSSVDLGPESAIVVAFTDDLRRVTLLAGQAFFDVRPQSASERRAFSVDAANGTTTALGTQFVVENLDDRAAVTAVEHQIEVGLTPKAPSGLQAKRSGSLVLSPGETVQYSELKGLGPVERTAPGAATAWRQGMLVFDAAPLGDVVTRLNRYRHGRIIVMNSALARRRVSGVFPTKDLANVVDTIATELGARVVSAPPFLTFLY